MSKKLCRLVNGRFKGNFHSTASCRDRRPGILLLKPIPDQGTEWLIIDNPPLADGDSKVITDASADSTGNVFKDFISHFDFSRRTGNTDLAKSLTQIETVRNRIELV